MGSRVLWAHPGPRHEPRQLRDDEWRDALAGNFNGLVPEPPARGESQGSASAQGWLAAAQLGDVAAFHVAGTTQTLVRSPARARKQPSDLLKVCIQRAGTATISQDGRQVLLAPGTMAIYDIDQPYTIALQGDWRCSVIAFPRSAFVASRHFIEAVICRSTSVRQGPGSVLAPLVASAINGEGSGGSSEVLMGHASLDLLRAALAAERLPERPDAVMLAIDSYIRRHLADPELSHSKVAAAHHMSERTLHRLFEASGQSVTELIRAYRLDGILADLRSASSAADSINQVAARWGLHDMPHLTRAFRARFAMTPTQARQSNGRPIDSGPLPFDCGPLPLGCADFSLIARSQKPQGRQNDSATEGKSAKPMRSAPEPMGSGPQPGG